MIKASIEPNWSCNIIISPDLSYQRGRGIQVAGLTEDEDLGPGMTRNYVYLVKHEKYLFVIFRVSFKAWILIKQIFIQDIITDNLCYLT